MPALDAYQARLRVDAVDDALETCGKLLGIARAARACHESCGNAKRLCSAAEVLLSRLRGQLELLRPEGR